MLCFLVTFVLTTLGWGALLWLGLRQLFRYLGIQPDDLKAAAIPFLSQMFKRPAKSVDSATNPHAGETEQTNP
jgi:hypothetical protein